MKRLLHIPLLLLLLSTALPVRGTELRDSLQQVLLQTTQPASRLDLLLNILDLSEEEDDEFATALTLYREAEAAGDSFALAAALGPLTLKTIDIPEKRDSLMEFLAGVERLLEGTSQEGVATYYRVVCRARDLSSGDRDQRMAHCVSLSQELSLRQPSNVYEQAGRLFLLGCADYVLTSSTEGIANHSPLPYLEEAWQTAQSFPANARKNFCGNIYTLLSQLYNNGMQDEKLIDISNTYLSLLDEYFAQEVVKRRRPYFYKDNLYLLCYQQLMLNSKVIGKERAQEYFERFRHYMRHGKGDPMQRDRFYLYSFSYSYYIQREEFPEALASIDSLIAHIENTRALNIRSVTYYKARANILRRMKRFDQACTAYMRAQNVADSLSRSQQLQQIGELQVGYEIDRLKLATARLSAHRHRIALLSSLGLLLLIAAFSFYTFRRLRRTQRLQRELLEQRRQAAAADEQKTEFINSICHEVRTPLNCVYGFSELLYEEKDPALQQEYTHIIEENSRQLGFMLNDLLEVTYLENLTSPLPIERAEVRALFCQAVARSEDVDKGRLEHIVEGPEATLHTNPHYFRLLVGCLLSNARKFTSQGRITLTWTVELSSGMLHAAVEDTGCGIPTSERERVFDRFVKLDSFRPGNGLGLYLCRLIASKLGGTVRIVDAYQGGTRVVFELPLEGPDTDTGQNK